jgi:hypothetical protein
MLVRFTVTLSTSEHLLYWQRHKPAPLEIASITVTRQSLPPSARVQPAARLDKKIIALFRATVSADLLRIVCGCRGKYRHPTNVTMYHCLILAPPSIWATSRHWTVIIDMAVAAEIKMFMKQNMFPLTVNGVWCNNFINIQLWFPGFNSVFICRESHLTFILPTDKHMPWHERQGLFVSSAPCESASTYQKTVAFLWSVIPHLNQSRTLQKVFGTDHGEHLLNSRYEGKFILLLIFLFRFMVIQWSLL